MVLIVLQKTNLQPYLVRTESDILGNIMYFTLLDVLRFLSSVAVFFHHTFAFHYGKLGVYLFFMISGFVIYFSIHKGLKEYAIGRFLRLYPLYWVCITLTYLVTIFYNNNLPLDRYLLGFVMFNDGKIAQLIDGSYWTLTFELLFYFYIAVFVKLFSAKRLVWFYISWLLISFFSFFLSVDQNIIAKLLSVRFAPYFAFGGILALLIDRYRVVDTKTKALFMGTLIVSALLPIYVSAKLRAQLGIISNFTASFEPDEMVIVELFFILMPLAVYFSYFSFTRSKTFSKVCFILGGITYPLYLLHWKIGDIVITANGYTYGEVNYFSVVIATLIFSVAYVLSEYDLTLRKFLKKILRIN